MTAYNLMPTFTNHREYIAWINVWKATYNRLSADIWKQKKSIKLAQAAGEVSSLAQRELYYNQRTAFKMMTLLSEAKLRKERIKAMHNEIDEQNAMFPLDLGICKNIDFHYNKGANEFTFLPLWVVRIKGRSYYVSDVYANAPWNTHERNAGSTRGVIRFKKANVMIDENNIAHIDANIA